MQQPPVQQPNDVFCISCRPGHRRYLYDTSQYRVSICARSFVLYCCCSSSTDRNNSNFTSFGTNQPHRANMGGTWPSSFVMYLMGAFSSPADCAMNSEGIETCVGGRDAYVPLQIAMSVIGLAWIAMLGGKVKTISELPDEAWRTNLLDQDLASVVVVPDVESNNSNSKTKDCSKRE
mmetsp:Transcript_18386/g.26417  ORF Transcript_18386/g.26417 Transcript_18386/m.26417 type:complete len:177 (+) Transcript_18386:108-638(+)